MAAPAIDVFISFKSEDEAFARQVYQRLVAEGATVFFSRESLPRLGSDQYREQIDAAIDGAHHMVLVTSSAEFAMSPWVKHEWGLFLGELLAGRKTGNLISVLAGGMPLNDLPISLRNREVLGLEPDQLDRLVEFTRVQRAALPVNDAFPVMAELLSGDQDRIRLGLGRIPAADRSGYLARLRATVSTGSPLERRSSLMALFLLGDSDLAISLIVAANDADAFVRRQAMFLIGRARAMRARDAVSARLADANPDVRAAAKEAQRKLTGGRG